MSLMFDENSISETTNPLIKALRQTFYDNKMTEEMFKERYRAYGQKLGKTSVAINTELSELTRISLRQTDRHMTYKFFEHIMRATFGDFAVEIVLQDDAESELVKTLMFTEADVAKATNPLARRMRQLFYDGRITVSEFKQRVREFGLKQGNSDDTIATNYSNTRKILQMSDDVTLRLFNYIIKSIFGMKIVAFKIKITEPVDQTPIIITRAMLKTLVDNTRENLDNLTDLIDRTTDASKADYVNYRKSAEKAVVDGESLLEASRSSEETANRVRNTFAGGRYDSSIL